MRVQGHTFNRIHTAFQFEMTSGLIYVAVEVRNQRLGHNRNCAFCTISYTTLKRVMYQVLLLDLSPQRTQGSYNWKQPKMAAIITVLYNVFFISLCKYMYIGLLNNVVYALVYNIIEWLDEQVMARG